MRAAFATRIRLTADIYTARRGGELGSSLVNWRKGEILTLALESEFHGPLGKSRKLEQQLRGNLIQP